MTIVTGDEASRLLRDINSASDIDPSIYDYSVEHGVVLIDKKTKECGYVKATRGRAAIAIKGSPEEFGHLLKALNTFDISDMIKFVKEMK